VRAWVVDPREFDGQIQGDLRRFAVSPSPLAFYSWWCSARSVEFFLPYNGTMFAEYANGAWHWNFNPPGVINPPDYSKPTGARPPITPAYPY